ncbi:hypothetical protein FC15_GL000863 [Lapidilactobacillus concavus DSM 17758]|uniref:Uncharacterized protein n=1 Tax=Lapidilactobacillus concavus DSM 17758 TaxID=1423735 RepID=A0A0R1VXL6_9LACO|nr:hypothetical protein FC15_GL000863 [Lapidilactobacillus concavus DSM 17758]
MTNYNRAFAQKNPQLTTQLGTIIYRGTTQLPAIADNLKVRKVNQPVQRLL